MSTANPLGNWNPFEDSKNFSDLTEEALFGEQFDSIRLQEHEQSPQKQKPDRSRRDPFVSAPFVAATKDVS